MNTKSRTVCDTKEGKQNMKIASEKKGKSYQKAPDITYNFQPALNTFVYRVDMIRISLHMIELMLTWTNESRDKIKKKKKKSFY